MARLRVERRVGTRYGRSVSADLQEVVAASADSAELHAPVPTLLLELQTLLGSLTAAVTAGTERGRRPYRPGPDWTPRLGELAYGIYLLADQTGVPLADAVRATAEQLRSQAERTRAEAHNDWPVPS
jgi:hypothetical protein